MLITISGVTPMGSEWAISRAPGLRGHPGAPLTLVFQLRLPPRLHFQKGAPFQHFFFKVWLLSSHNDAFHKLMKSESFGCP